MTEHTYFAWLGASDSKDRGRAPSAVTAPEFRSRARATEMTMHASEEPNSGGHEGNGAMPPSSVDAETDTALPMPAGEVPDQVVVSIRSARAKTKSPKPSQPASNAGAPTKTPRPLKPWETELRSKLDLSTNPRTGSESIRPTSANVATILKEHPEWRGVVALNTFHLRLEATRIPSWHEDDMPSDPKPGPWTEGDTARLVHWLSRTWIADMPPINVSVRTVDSAVLVAAEANTFHPVRVYLRGLSWDGESRIDCLARNYLGGDLTPYACAVGASFMIGAVARVMDPGCKLDTCVILEGEQGARKSTFLEALALPWFADSKLPIGDKDAFQQLPGTWLYELGELAALSKADVEEVKAFLSSRQDRFRPSYGKYVTDVPRQTVFAGTTNAGEYLHDVTGGRRFLPLRTGTIDLEATRRDRDQLWAEAFARYEKGERWWLDDALARPEQAARFVEDEWQAKIRVWLVGRTSTTVGEILAELIFAEPDHRRDERGLPVRDEHGVPLTLLKNSMGRWGQREQNRVARCLTSLRWVRRQQRVGGQDDAGNYRREWRYVSPDHTSTDDEVVT